MATQLPLNSFKIKKIQKLVVNESHPVEQSKDDIWKFRQEPRDSARRQALIDAKRITRSDFLRTAADLAEVYFDHSDLLLERPDFFLKILNNPDAITFIETISKIF